MPAAADGGTHTTACDVVDVLPCAQAIRNFFTREMPSRPRFPRCLLADQPVASVACRAILSQPITQNKVSSQDNEPEVPWLPDYLPTYLPIVALNFLLAQPPTPVGPLGGLFPGRYRTSKKLFETMNPSSTAIK